MYGTNLIAKFSCPIKIIKGMNRKIYTIRKRMKTRKNNNAVNKGAVKRKEKNQ